MFKRRKYMGFMLSAMNIRVTFLKKEMLIFIGISG